MTDRVFRMEYLKKREQELREEKALKEQEKRVRGLEQDVRPSKGLRLKRRMVKAGKRVDKHLASQYGPPPRAKKVKKKKKRRVQPPSFGFDLGW